MVEWETNTVLLYPVSDRSEETLIPIIQRHVEPGATIYSDGWSSYCSLNELGYNHFTVLHKYSFKKVYVKEGTGEEVQVHTNRIEGAWKHAKDHFRRMSGTKLSQFEGHCARSCGGPR
jgi:transposase-like protein